MPDEPRRSGWPDRPGLGEADLFRGYGAVLEPETVRARQPSAGAGERRPSPLRPGDRSGPLSGLLRAGRRGPGAGPPIRLVIYAPGPEHFEPWRDWLRGLGWHVHSQGAATYAHDPSRPDLPGYLVGFGIAGEPGPAWLRWLRVHQTDATPRRHARHLEAAR